MDKANAQLIAAQAASVKAQTANTEAHTKLLLAQAEELSFKNRETAGKHGDRAGVAGSSNRRPEMSELKCPECGHPMSRTFCSPEPTKFLGGCNCAFKAPTVPTCRDSMQHLDDCPAKGSGYPVGAVLAAPVLSAPSVAPTYTSGKKA